MEPLRGSMIDLNAVSIIDEIPPGFPNDPCYLCLNLGAVPSIVNNKKGVFIKTP